MANFMAYISFLLSFIFLLSSHVLTHELFKENSMINVDWYDPSARRYKVLRPRSGRFPPSPPWSQHFSPWPDRSFGSPPLHARPKKNKHNAASSPPPIKMDYYTHSFGFYYNNDGFISETESNTEDGSVTRH
ncbi:hypothetical protein AAHE18_07G029800 [Arachis hypogaea]|nr:uncharacterized protein LOC112703899 isoform X2 [Arachis hypogaea]